jgi:hypothetical protein
VIHRLFVLLVVLMSTSCGKSRGEDPATAPPTTIAAPRIVSPPTIAPELPPGPSATVPSCAPPLRVTGGALATRWPALIGRQVRLRARIERAIDFTDAFVTADGRRFVVSLAPDEMWSGVQLHTFVALGSTTAPLRGRVVLPHLLLADTGSCAP